MVQATETNFLQTQLETEIVDSAFDLKSNISLLVTVINHLNKHICSKKRYVLGKLVSFHDMVNFQEVMHSVLKTERHMDNIIRLVQ